MEIGATVWAFSGVFYVVGAVAVVISLAALRRRVQLSSAKHPSLAGHARMARRVASLIPFYDYDEKRFFTSDGAPDDIAALRRAGFKRLSALYAEHFRETNRLTKEVVDKISDVQFTRTYRVPFQYSRYVRRHLEVGAFVASSDGVTV